MLVTTRAPVQVVTLGISLDPHVFLSSPPSSCKNHQRIHTLHNPLYHIPQSGRDNFGRLELHLEELDFVELVVFDLLELGREDLDLVEVFGVQVSLMELEDFGNGLVYWSLRLGGSGLFGLRHLVELGKDLVIEAMFRD
ncbi:hypothetical protein P3S68_003031 [Capsicum galapagoense]